MPIDWKRIKQANSKSELVSALKVDRIALEWYARHENWVKAHVIRDNGAQQNAWVWIGDNYPPYAAEVTLGLRKPDTDYRNNWQLKAEEGGNSGSNNENQANSKG